VTAAKKDMRHSLYEIGDRYPMAIRCLWRQKQATVDLRAALNFKGGDDGVVIEPQHVDEFAGLAQPIHELVDGLIGVAPVCSR
jgi:hypothetical protein